MDSMSSRPRSSRPRSSPGHKHIGVVPVATSIVTSAAPGMGGRDLLDVCELSFAKNLRDLQAGLLHDLRATIHLALDPLRDELAATVAESRAAAAFEKIQHRFDSFEVPQFDAEPLLKFLGNSFRRQEELSRQGQDEVLQAHSEAMQALREELCEARGQEKEALAALREKVGQVEDGLQGTQSRLDKVVEMQDDLLRTAESLGARLGQVQARTTQQSEEFSVNLETQLSKYICERPVNVDFAQVLVSIGDSHGSVCNDMMVVLNEITKVQQALNVDFMRVWDKKLQLTGKCHKRVRDSGVQTIGHGNSADACCQTTGVFLEQEKKKKKKDKAENLNAMRSFNSVNAVAAVFQDAEKMKEQARLALIRPQYDVRDFYKEDGYIQWVCRSSWFESLTLLVIIANCIWMAVDADYNHAPILYDAHPLFQVAENLFCFYFSTEVVLRFLAFQNKASSLRDPWFVFDSMLVMLMVMETWVMTLALIVSGGGMSSTSLNQGTILRVVRTVKMLRVSRMARLMRSVPELVILTKGIKAASRSVLVFLCMWAIIVFVFALVFRQLSDDGSYLFASIPSAVGSLFLNGVFAVYAPLVRGAYDENWLFLPLTVIFIALTVLTLMNMLVGVIIESVNAIAATEKESMTTLYVSTQLRRAYHTRDMEEDACLTEAQFMGFVVQPDVARLAESVGVDVMLLVDMAPNLFDDTSKGGDNGMSFEKFVELILNMRGTNPAKVKDMKETLKVMKVVLRESQKNMEENMSYLSQEMAEMRRDFKDLQAAAEKGFGTKDEDNSDDDMGDLSTVKSRG